VVEAVVVRQSASDFDIARTAKSARSRDAVSCQGLSRSLLVPKPPKISSTDAPSRNKALLVAVDGYRPIATFQQATPIRYPGTERAGSLTAADALGEVWSSGFLTDPVLIPWLSLPR
jgi:hypothetical protein